MAADVFQGGDQFLFRGNPSLAAEKAPDFGQGAGSDVVGPVRVPMQGDGLLQKGEQTRLDGHGFRGRKAVEAAYFALIAINAQLVFQPLYQIERLQSVFRPVAVLPGIEKDLKVAGHRPAAEVQEEGWGVGGVSAEW